MNNKSVTPTYYCLSILIGLIIAGLGQWILGKPAVLAQLLSFHHSANLIIGFILLLSGAAVFGYVIWKSNVQLPDKRPSSLLSNVSISSDKVISCFVPIIFTALFLFLHVMIKLLDNEYTHIISLLFLIVLILFAFVFAAYDYWNGTKWWNPPSILDMVFILFFMTVFIGLNTHDLTNWYYSAIGDDYSYFSRARFLTQGGQFNPFSQSGVYVTHPEMDSLYQAAIMKLFGINHFGWKLSGIIAVALSLPFFYLLVSNLWDRKTAVFSTMIVSSSHFLYGYVHTGYNTVHALPITIASFWCFFAAYRRQSVLFYFGAGVLTALCFYTYFPARITLAVLSVFTLILFKARPPLRLLIPAIVGGLLVLAPFIAVNGMEIITKMIYQSAFEHEPYIVGDPIDRIVNNIHIHLIAFNYNYHAHHFVWGSLLDPISAVLAVLGLGAIFAEITRNKRVLFLIIWWLVAFAATAIFNPHGYVSMNRINFLVPCYAILVGLAIRYSIIIFESLKLEAKIRQAIQIFALIILFCSIFALNLYRFWVQSPPHVPIALEAVAVKAVRSNECKRVPGNPVVAGGQTDLVQIIFESYPKQTTPKVISTEQLLSSLLKHSKDASCIVYIRWFNESNSVDLKIAHALKADNRNWQSQIITDYGGYRIANIYYLVK